MRNCALIFLLILSLTIHAQESERPIDFIFIETPPVYSGCEKMKSTSNRKACSNKLLLKHIETNFNNKISQKTDLKPGEYYVYVSFVVDKEGNITDIKRKGIDFEPFVNESIRLVKSIPKYAIPGFHRGKVANVKITLPIAFIVSKEEN